MLPTTETIKKPRTAAKKAAPKKSSSRTPLLDAAKKSSPHVGGIWNGDAGAALAVECANQTRADMKLVDFLNLAKEYKDVAGWKNIFLAAAVKYGVTTNRKFAGK